jgi:ParB family chromosome partitioning protein
MATKGLGRGLGSLISMFDEEEDSRAVNPLRSIMGGDQDLQIAPASSPVVVKVDKSERGVLEIDISLIDNNIDQPRKEFDPEKLQELADSIRANGVIQPILLNKVGTRYMIVAGERRWRASKIAEKRTIPAVVREFTRAQIAEIAIVENLQREDLNEIELARGIKKLMADFTLTQEQVAVRLGKNRSSIANTLRLLSLPTEVIRLIEENQLTSGHAKCLAGLQNKELIVKLAKRCVAEQLTVRALERLINDIHSTKLPSASTSHAPQSLELKDFARKLEKVLATKVLIQGNMNKGKVVIEYFSQQDLLRIRKHIIDINELHTVEGLLKKKIDG